MSKRNRTNAPKQAASTVTAPRAGDRATTLDRLFVAAWCGGKDFDAVNGYLGTRFSDDQLAAVAGWYRSQGVELPAVPGAV